jgi:hypothetical protein
MLGWALGDSHKHFRIGLEIHMALQLMTMCMAIVSFPPVFVGRYVLVFLFLFSANYHLWIIVHVDHEFSFCWLNVLSFIKTKHELFFIILLCEHVTIIC